MITKKELEQLLAKLEHYLPDSTLKNKPDKINKKPGRPKKYDDRLVLFLIALRDKYNWSLRELEKNAKEIMPKNVEVPDFSSIHYRIRKMREHLEEVKSKIAKLIPNIELEENSKAKDSKKSKTAKKVETKKSSFKNSKH